MNLYTWFLSNLIGFGIGGPFSKLVFLEQNASFESPFDMYNWNVIYDLATLYGDTNKDGILSQEEYKSFVNTEYNKLIPDNFNNAKDENGNILVDDSFSFLGLLPVNNNSVYAYVFTKNQISSTYTDGGYFKYSSLNYEYGLSYYNNPEIVDGKYVNTIPKTSSMKFINEYSLGNKGYFSKFIIEDNQIINKQEEVKTSDVYYSLRIKPERIIVTYKNESVLDKKITNYELSFDSNYWNNDNRMKNTLFHEKTVKIEDSVIDGFLCSNDSAKTGSGWNFLLGTISGNEETVTNSAYEFYYYFFNLEDFDPDSILSITYSYVPITWTHSYYNKAIQNQFGFEGLNIANQVINSAQKGITAYTRENAKKIVNESKDNPFYIVNSGKSNEKKYYLEYSESIGSRITKTVNYDEDFVVDVKVPEFWKLNKHTRKVNVKSIIDLKNIDSELGEKKELVNNNSNKEYDLNSQLRSFLKGETTEEIDALYENVDHNKYKWAFLIHEEDWIRKAKYETIEEYPVGLTWLWRILTASIYTYTSNVSKITSTCHEPDSVLITYMKVAKDNEYYNLNVISNPKSVRKNYIVGYSAPGIIDIISKEFNSFFKEYGWVVWIILGVIILLLIGLLGTIFRPVKAILKIIIKGIIAGLKVIINTLYILLVWWWFAIFKKASGSSIPPLWIFKRR